MATGGVGSQSSMRSIMLGAINLSAKAGDIKTATAAFAAAVLPGRRADSASGDRIGATEEAEGDRNP